MNCKSCGKPISVTREGGRCTNEKCEKSGGYKERMPVGKYEAELFKKGKKSNPLSLTKKEYIAKAASRGGIAEDIYEKDK